MVTRERRNWLVGLLFAAAMGFFVGGSFVAALQTPLSRTDIDRSTEPAANVFVSLWWRASWGPRTGQHSERNVAEYNL
jgi:hypothetical protein